MIKIKNLTKYYGNARGCENVNLEVKKGEIFGFIGPNGAGKSTTIRCIMNLINKNSGEIYINNELVDKKNYNIKELIGYLASDVRLYDDLTVNGIIKYSNSFYKKDCMKKANKLVKYLDLDLKKRIEDLSFGNLKKLGIVLALMHDPKIIILDEASSGLDPLVQEKFYNLLLEETAKGNTILFSTHILSEIKRICDRVAIIKDGSIIKVSDIKSLDETNSHIITINSKDISKIKKTLNSKIIKETKDTLEFMYDGDINKLVKELSKYKLDKLLIEESSIEEIFLHYYEKEN